MIRIGLVGCGHIGTVHAFVLQQLAKAGLVDAALTATFDDDPERAERCGPAPRRGAGRIARRVLAAVDAVWVCTWTAAHLAAVEAAADASGRCSARSPSRPISRDRERVVAALRARPAPGRARAAVVAGVRS